MTQPLPTEYAPLITAAINVARRRVEAGDELPGLAFIDAGGILANPEDFKRTRLIVEDGLIAVPMVAAPTKDAWAAVVRLLSGAINARFVMIVSEVWINRDKEQLKRINDEGLAVSEMPGSVEAMFVQVETLQGTWAGLADLVPAPHLQRNASDPPSRTFGEMTLEMDKLSSGRLVGLLGTRPSGRPQ